MNTSPRLPVDASIAVLPFSTLSDDASDRYFSEGLSAELLSACLLYTSDAADE